MRKPPSPIGLFFGQTLTAIAGSIIGGGGAILLILFVSWLPGVTFNSFEVGPHQYEEIKKLCEDHPGFVEVIQPELQDDKVTMAEYIDIKGKLDNFKNKTIVSELKQ